MESTSAASAIPGGTSICELSFAALDHRTCCNEDPMPDRTNRRIVLASRPEGAPQPVNFRLEQSPAPQPKDGEVLLRTIWLSFDPYMRGRMSAARSYAKPVEVGEPMIGGTVNEVV